ncbi:MAG TPA: tRNA pseudouridine(55) synthase TruB [Rhodospirillales bacterium]|nr:tRNA pseudouridine(55) synthase TruB [Rhodospirillales bacterium]
MGRRRGGTPIHGWLIIDKPRGLTSNAVVGRVRRMTDAAKVGHGGTLDPLATGILPLALGEATKTVSYAMDGKKVYVFTVRWGEQTESDDSEGAVTETSDVRPTEQDIRENLKFFTGEIEQVPPVFSAIKVDGRRAYDLARNKEPVELAPRKVQIETIALLDRPDKDHAVFEVACGKGTYVRSIARDLARKLGTFGHVSALRRTRVGPFGEDRAISLDKLDGLGHSAPLADLLLPVETVLDDIPALALTEEEARRLRHGQGVSALHVVSRSPLENISQGVVVCAMAEGKPVALARIEGGEIRPLRVFNM